MSDVIIAVENLSKSYRLQHQTRERYTALFTADARSNVGAAQLCKCTKEHDR